MTASVRATNRERSGTEAGPPDHHDTTPPAAAKAKTWETAEAGPEPIPQGPNAAKQRKADSGTPEESANASAPTQHPTATDRPEPTTEATTACTWGAKEIGSEREPATATTPGAITKQRPKSWEQHGEPERKPLHQPNKPTERKTPTRLNGDQQERPLWRRKPEPATRTLWTPASRQNLNAPKPGAHNRTTPDPPRQRTQVTQTAKINKPELETSQGQPEVHDETKPSRHEADAQQHRHPDEKEQRQNQNA
jgi:hypothetical protein